MHLATDLYGGLAAPNLTAVSNTKMVTGGSKIPDADPVAAPAAAVSAAAIGDIFDDPTFWLVAVIGAVFALVSVSK